MPSSSFGVTSRYQLSFGFQRADFLTGIVTIRLLRQIKKKCVVIFLDLLGFKCFTVKDPDAALGMLEDFNSVRSMWRQIGRMENPLCAPQGLGNPAPQLTSVESFNCFIPMSDSVFILSDEPDNAIRQLSNFLIGCFCHRGWAFGNSNPRNVHEQCGKGLVIDRQGKPRVREYKENWYPVLFRGGISYAKAKAVQNPAVYEGEEITVPNVIGPGVVRAVQLEQGGLKGPRILCDGEFVDELTCQTKRYLRQVGDAWELLWPAFSYIDRNGESNQRDVLDELFWPAFRLWQCYSGKPKEEEHYRAFLELIVRSHIAYAGIASNPEPVYEYMHETLDKAGLRLSGTDLNAKLVFSKVNDNAQER